MIMAEREMAHRMFAREFNDSVFQISSGSDASGQTDLHAPNFLVTRLGAKVNRLFIAGVITEVEDMGSHKGGEKELWRARLSDPTGTFTVYSGSYQPEASVFLSTVEIPSYVTIVGKVRSYEPGDGSVFVSLRPEEINNTDENTRDRWIIDTAELTLDRLDVFEEALLSGLGGTELFDHLALKDVLSHAAEGIRIALDYYHTDNAYLEAMRKQIKDALLSIENDLPAVSGDRLDIEQFLMNLLQERNAGKGMEYAVLLEEAGSKNIPVELIDRAVRSLLSDGNIYEPRAGFFRAVA
jgi:RPA family protein